MSKLQERLLPIKLELSALGSPKVPGVWKRASTPIESADYADYTDKKLATKKHKRSN